MVTRGRYRIGQCAILGENDTRILLAGEITVFRVVEGNPYGLSPYLLLYLLTDAFVQEQMKNRVFVETTLQNLGDRWRDLHLPIPRDETATSITEEVKCITSTRAMMLDRIFKIFRSDWLGIEYRRTERGMGQL
jgi:type I restriction enzyme M protein